jgi:TolB-like protein/predicted Zn-dependent protease
MTEPSRAVFLSYASEDAEAARRMCEALRAAGIEVWFDQSELRGGDAWDRQIRKQIHDCLLFIPIISVHSQARLEGYFRREWKLAVDRTHDMAEEKAFLVPVVIDETSERAASVPDKFREVQWSRVPAGQTSPAFVERVLRLLARYPQSGRSTAAAAVAPSPRGGPVLREPPSSPSAFWWPKTALWLIVAAVVIAIGWLTLDKLWLSKRVTAGTQTTASRSLSGTGAQRPVTERSIAVLPFVDLSEKHDQEYFADGMAEEIIDLLVKIPELKVIGRTSSFQFKGKTDDLRKIGATLGAAYVVEGSVRRSGDHIRVTAQLIDARDGAHRWSETYDRDARDVIKVQGEIASSLVRELQLEVTSALNLQERSVPVNEEAYDSYLRGQHALNRFDQQGFEEAAADYRRALKADPSFAPAADGLALSLANLADWGLVAPEVGWEQARATAKAALKLNSNSPLGHTILGSIYTFYDWNWPAAHREFDTAVALAPNSSTVLVRAARERLAVGDWSEARSYVDTASTADPLDATAFLVRAWTYARIGRLDEAERAARRIVQIAPNFETGHYNLGVVLLIEGKAAEALSEMQLENLPSARLSGLALVYHAVHRIKDSDQALARLVADNDVNIAMSLAEVYAYRGERDKAFAWLDMAFKQKDAFLWFIKADPLLKNLESDPSYKAFLHKMNLPE